MTASPTPDLTPNEALVLAAIHACKDTSWEASQRTYVELARHALNIRDIKRALSREPEAGKAEPMVIGWISVGDRVPDVDAPYHLSEAVIVTDGTYRREARYSTDNDGSGSWSLWSGRFGSHLHPQPTHWMPYPPILALKSEGAPATAAPSPSPQGNDTMEPTPAPPDAARPCGLDVVAWQEDCFVHDRSHDGRQAYFYAEEVRTYALRLERDLAAARETIAKLEKEVAERKSFCDQYGTRAVQAEARCVALERDAAAAKEQIATLDRQVMDRLKLYDMARAALSDAKREAQSWKNLAIEQKDPLYSVGGDLRALDVAGWCDAALKAEQALAAANARLAELDKLDVLGFQSRMIAAEAEAAKLRERLESREPRYFTGDDQCRAMTKLNPKALIDAGWVPREVAIDSHADAYRMDRAARIDAGAKSWLAARGGGEKPQ